ncbi:hypothetical protein EDD18DRAFT_1350093 [Armillaria luteobubalina]|uniref:Uncharacterized protein n=1 Tax=Armillaria luteobubalina TaxID=153913 RepID=A0AA39Q9B6_9AGAR|nr:hypothetical protein EDD18DRAFT_1350093 [Armillaria luteobubalina]
MEFVQSPARRPPRIFGEEQGGSACRGWCWVGYSTSAATEQERDTTGMEMLGDQGRMDDGIGIRVDRNEIFWTRRVPLELGALRDAFYLYYLAFPNDRKEGKCLVYGIYVIECAQTMLVAHDMFGYGSGDVDALTRSSFNWPIVPAVGARRIRSYPCSVTYYGFAAGVGQVFYAYRRTIPIFVVCVRRSAALSFISGRLTDEREFTDIPDEFCGDRRVLSPSRRPHWGVQPEDVYHCWGVWTVGLDVPYSSG